MSIIPVKYKFSNRSISLINETITGDIILNQSGTGSNDNEGSLHIPMIWSFTNRCSLMSYSEHTPFCVCVCVGGSYFCAGNIGSVF